MRRTKLAALAAAVATVVVALAAAGGTVHAQNDPASRSLRWLLTQQVADGSLPAGYPTYSPTEQLVIGAAAAGYDPSALRSSAGNSPVDYLRRNAAAASSSAGATGELLEAVVAAGQSPASFGGVNLLSRLDSFYDSSTGAYGDGETFTQSLAVLGLRAAAAGVPLRAVDYLRSLQDSDGGWNFQAAANSTASDTNDTAIAVMALAAAGDHSAIPAAISWLRAQQDSDGGFPYQAGDGSDADSDALVLQAILAAGEDPGGCSWMSGGHGVYTNLTALQSPDGGFAGYTGSEDVYTTSETAAALAMQSFPVSATSGTNQTPAGQQSAALHALLFLRGQQSATDGSVQSGYPSYSPTEMYVIGAAAAGYDPATLRRASGDPTAIDYLAAHAADASSDAAQTGMLIQAVVAAAQDPHSFGGADLLSRLDSFYNASTGVYGDGQTFTQSLALLGLRAAGVAQPGAALTALHRMADSDGSWNYTGTAGSTAGDTNSTAMALMALDSAGDHTADAAAVTWLLGQQDPGGGFPYQAGSGSDPDSDGLVLQALLGSWRDPAAYAHGGGTVITDLLGLQGGDGGFPGYTGSADAFTTASIPVALERVPLPVNPRPKAGAGLDAAAPGGWAAWQPQQSCSSGSGIAPPVTTTSPTPVPAGGSTAQPGGGRTTTSGTGTGTTAAEAPADTATPAPTPSPTGGILGTSASPSPWAPGTALLPGPVPGGPSPLLLYLLIGLGAAVVAGGAGALMLRRP